METIYHSETGLSLVTKLLLNNDVNTRYYNCMRMIIRKLERTDSLNNEINYLIIFQLPNIIEQIAKEVSSGVTNLTEIKTSYNCDMLNAICLKLINISFYNLLQNCGISTNHRANEITLTNNTLFTWLEITTGSKVTVLAI